MVLHIAAVEEDKEWNHEADNVGVHIADPTIAEQFGGNVVLFWWLLQWGGEYKEERGDVFYREPTKGEYNNGKKKEALEREEWMTFYKKI